MDAAITRSLDNLIERLGKLPGIGPKTAERLAFHILKADMDQAMALAEAIKDVKTRIKRCDNCSNLSEQPLCTICSDTRRDSGVICVVEQTRDVVAIEKTGVCSWVYHVLGGHISPLDGIQPEDLTIGKLLERIRSGGVREVIMATNPNMSGDGTALYIGSVLRPTGVKITRLARGIPTGGTIEYSSSRMLADAITGRQQFQ